MVTILLSILSNLEFWLQGNSYPAVTADDANGNGSATSGSSLTGAVDINLDTTLSGNLTLDVTKTDQFIKRTSGNVDFHLEVNEATARNMNITANNANAGGTANINITADNEITIASTDAAYFVNVEDYRFQQNVLSTNNSTMVLDPVMMTQRRVLCRFVVTFK